tara:strand:- start:637 stop:1005 length:369 start_codon:yes stop_codon:yes gene_type:complete
MKSKSKPKGLGDIVEKVATVTGVKSAVDTLIGEECGCTERRDKLNELFPMYKNIEMSNDQRQVWEDLQPAIATGRLRGKDSQNFKTLYDDIFEKRHKWCGCGGETPRRVKHIKKVYEYTCDK